MEKIPATQKQIATESGFCRQTIAKYQKTGILSKDDDIVTALGKLVRYLAGDVNTAGDSDFQAERTRLTREQADKLERERLLAEGKLLETDAVLDWVGRGDQRVRSKILSIPSRCAPLVIGRKITEVEKIMTDVVYEALKELADTSELKQCQKRC